jgi:hypothetical protein
MHITEMWIRSQQVPRAGPPYQDVQLRTGRLRAQFVHQRSGEHRIANAREGYYQYLLHCFRLHHTPSRTRDAGKIKALGFSAFTL